MHSQVSQPNRLLILLRNFFLGRQDQMNLPALRWWNHNRLAYNLRLIGCLAIGQLLLLWVGYSEGLIPSQGMFHRISVWFWSDLILLAFMNVLYFLLPWLEVAVFKGRPEKFRAYSFAFINTISALFVAFAIFTAVLMG